MRFVEAGPFESDFRQRDHPMVAARSIVTKALLVASTTTSSEPTGLGGILRAFRARDFMGGELRPLTQRQPQCPHGGRTMGIRRGTPADMGKPRARGNDGKPSENANHPARAGPR